MRRSIRTPQALLSVAVVLLVGCRETTAPHALVRVGSRFVLVAVGDRLLPAPEAENPASPTIPADTIVFIAVDIRGSGAVEHHQTTRSSTGDAVRVIYRREFDSKAGMLAVGSPDLVLNFHAPPMACPPFALCPRFIAETGRLTADALTISYGDPSERPRTYLRAGF